MKRKIIFLTAIMLLSTLSVGVAAAGKMLSPALDMISSESCMIKTGSTNGAVCFDEADFTIHAGLEKSSLCITSLPPESDGTLMLGSTPVSAGQTISSANLSLLRFVPMGDTTETSFLFTSDENYTTECIIKITDIPGSTPTAAGGGMTTVTQTDITCYGILDGDDPDGDILLYEIVSYPSNGIVSITDSKNGNFTYTPFEGFEGVDSFSYRVRDEYGNYSDACEVSMKIEPRQASEVLADMEDHWAHSAALSMVAGGYMDVISENGKLYFDPSENITREEYLATVMKALGAGELSTVTTVFADNDEIDAENTGYIAAAYKLGIIKGAESDIGLVFGPDESITRAEAAVILNRIIGAKANGTVAVFADNESIPAWAENDIYALSELGIMNGTGDNDIFASSTITRAETAHMLYVTKNIFSE